MPGLSLGALSRFDGVRQCGWHFVSDGYYIYLHGSDYYKYLVSQLVSPVCNSTGPHCFRFWYHMYGVAEEMALRVSVTKDKEQVLVWERTGNHGDRWHLGEVTVHSTGNMQVRAEALTAI